MTAIRGLLVGWFAVNTGLVASAEQAVQVKGVSVRGDAELPKVLYVVPWQAGYGRLYNEERELAAVSVEFDFVDPEKDRDRVEFRQRLSLDSTPFKKY